MGFERQARMGEDTEAINRMFTPEFRNRLDAIIGFKNLPADVVHRVVEKFVMQLEAQLADRQVTIELSDEAKAWLARKGYSPEYGARPLARVIQEHVKKPLAEELLFGKLARGGVVVVGVDDDKLTFTYPEGVAPPPPSDDEEEEKEPELVS
jgi:ATP-dependent Clp protease ATP-binding subunit ClpA